MIRRRFSPPFFVIATLIGCVGLAVGADQPKSTPAPTADAGSEPASFRVMKLDRKKAFAGFTKGESLQNRFLALRKEMTAAQQAGNNEKASQISHQLQQMQEGIQRLMFDALRAVVSEKKVDLVLDAISDPRAGSDVQVVYKEASTQVPDITPLISAKLNSLAATRPALDSQPASEPAAAQPMIKLNPRPKVHIDPPKPTK